MTIFGIHPLDNLLHICDVFTLDPKSVPTFNLSGTLCGKFNATEFVEIHDIFKFERNLSV